MRMVRVSRQQLAVKMYQQKVKQMEQGVKSLRVYQLAYELAMKIFIISKDFPKEERYALTDQIRRSSRSVCSNLAEGYRKRIYPRHFTAKLTDADGECSETLVWVDFAKDCQYISVEMHQELTDSYHSVGSMLGKMRRYPERFTPKSH